MRLGKPVILALAATEAIPGHAAHSPQSSVHTGSQIPGIPILTSYTFIHRGMFAPGWKRTGPDRTFTASTSAVKP